MSPSMQFTHVDQMYAYLAITRDNNLDDHHFSVVSIHQVEMFLGRGGIREDSVRSSVP